MFGELQVFDHDEIANHLLEQGLQTSPSQLHGCLCGLLAAGAPAGAETGLAGLNDALALDLHGELAEQAMQLYALSAQALTDEEFDFQPLLPDDEVEIAVRTEALAQWCQGFLAGYACASAGADRQRAALPEDSNEILRDFAAIAQASADEDNADEDGTQEEAENSYAELVEYIRFAALNAYMDTAAVLAGAGSAPAPERPPRDQPLH